MTDAFPDPMGGRALSLSGGQVRIVMQRTIAASRQAEFDSNGRAEIKTQAVPNGVQHEIQILSVRTTAGTPDLNVYRNAERDENWLDGTENGAADTVEYANGLVLMGHDVLVLVWTGGTSGEKASANIQFVEVKWVPMSDLAGLT